ncbi:MAG TPA: pyridoxine 5'-phosphate synthase [Candidatus Brocadiia bacterium]|nr:pyridoxine 5'-phosphate synthase [Candidatus Brocadiia bacterium]
MVKLGVNVDHVATVRQARRGAEPDPVAAAAICLMNGADIITIHLREDRRHISDRDLRLMRQTVTAKLNLEMAMAEEIVAIALEIRPQQVTIVPEKREEVTTEGGLGAASCRSRLLEIIPKMRANGIRVSLFIDPEDEQIEASREVGADCIELHTGRYANARTEQDAEAELAALEKGAALGRRLGLHVNAGHGLNYHNTLPLTLRVRPEELHIGHSIISRAIFAGLAAAVRDMKALCDEASRIFAAQA